MPELRYARRRLAWLCVALAGVPALVVYSLTAYRTITWWNSAEYSLSAITLGVPAPPGSLVAVLVGWLVTRLPLGVPDVFVLNLLAGLVAACTVALVARLACRLAEGEAEASSRERTLIAIASALSALPLAFGQTLWTYATRYTPYVFTALMTSLILLCLVRWWRSADDRRAVRWLFVAALLLGLDVSVHRTNAVLVPGIAAWILLRAPRTFVVPRAWAAGVGGVLLGLSPQLLLIPVAAKGALWVSGNPDTLARLWSYVSLEGQGGGFLIDLFPRNAPFLGVQVMDFLRAFAASFAKVGGALSVVGALPVGLGLVGAWSLWRRERRLAVAFLALFFLSAVTTILYFNIPANYFRSLHRHYLPCLVIFSALVCSGGAAVVRDALRARAPRGAIAVAAALVALVAVPAEHVVANYRSLDGSHATFAHDFAHNMLDPLPADAILVTAGDNDTFPLWYFQGAEGVRMDVSVVNIPLLNAEWFVRGTLREALGVTLAPGDSAAAFGPIPWDEDTVVVAVGPDRSAFALPDTVRIPDSVAFIVPPRAGGNLLAQDRVALRIVEANLGRRPIFVAVSAGAMLPWLVDYLRPEGLVRRLVPVDHPAPDAASLRRTLLETYTYRGYADSSVALDETTQRMGMLYYVAFRTLTDRLVADGDGDACRAVATFARGHLPPARFELDASMADNLVRACR